MIFWAASFPKSGNTWMRMLLASWLQDRDVALDRIGGWSDMAPEPWRVVTGKPDSLLTIPEITKNRPWVHSVLANKLLRDAMRPDYAIGSDEDVFVKTHSPIAEIDGYWTINPDVTKGAVYIVRDPRDVAISYAAHLGVGVDDAIALMESPHPLKNQGSPLFQYVGRWCDHVESWADAKGNVQIVRYEDLLARPVVHFRRILKAFGLKSLQGRVERAVERASFTRLREQEQKTGFAERSKKSKEAFFRVGKAGQWHSVLAADQIHRIEAVHGHVMERMGYARSVALAA